MKMQSAAGTIEVPRLKRQVCAGCGHKGCTLGIFWRDRRNKEHETFYCSLACGVRCRWRGVGRSWVRLTSEAGREPKQGVTPAGQQTRRAACPATKPPLVTRAMSRAHG